MKHLVYKELRLSIHGFFYILAFLLALLFFIPNWIFLLVFMYFFWITAPQIYSAYNAQQDFSFSMMLPISKPAYVKGKIYALLLIEGLHLVLGFLFGIIHNLIYGQFNWFFDVNVAFFGVVLGLFAVFNIVFLPQYFKTGYAFGKAVIYGIAATMLYSFIFEFGVFKYQWFRDIFEGPLGIQFIVAAIGILVTVVLNIVAIKQSVANYESSR